MLIAGQPGTGKTAIAMGKIELFFLSIVIIIVIIIIIIIIIIIK